MKREFGTKFWIGDVAWTVSLKRTYTDKCSSCGQRLFTEGLEPERIGITYVVFQCGHPPMYLEYYEGTIYYDSTLWATEAEAKAECDRRNKEIEKWKQ